MTSEQMVKELQTINAKLDRLLAGKTAAKSRAGEVADDADLDSQWGDPGIRYGLKVKYWAEQPDPFIGRRYSECSPEYLDATAKYLDACAYMARKDGEDKKAGYKERDAARARGWAQRKRNGWVPAATDEEAAGFADGELPPYSPYTSEDDIPFISNMTVSGRWWQP